MSAIMDSERCRLLMRQIAWSRSSLVNPSRCSSCNTNVRRQCHLQLSTSPRAPSPAQQWCIVLQILCSRYIRICNDAMVLVRIAGSSLCSMALFFC